MSTKESINSILTSLKFRKLVSSGMLFIFLIVIISAMFINEHSALWMKAKDIHSISWNIFIIVSIMHIILNRKSLLSYFKDKRFIIPAIVILLVFTAIILFL
jgi:hypothetical protein